MKQLAVSTFEFNFPMLFLFSQRQLERAGSLCSEGPGASVSAALAALEQAERLVIAGAGGDTSPPPSRSKRRGTP